MARDPQKTKKLTFDHAIQAWRLRREGWFQHRIAAEFGVNPGRINEILKERAHPGSRAAAEQGGHA